MSKEKVVLYSNKQLKNIKTSLTLLKEYALNADFKVPILLAQKLIKKNEVIPIISQPKNKTIKLPELTNKTILKTNKFNNNNKRSTRGS